jgi:SPP1 family predicted phage head-tail adaptor
LIARQYTRKIKIYDTVISSDSYGGNLVEDVFIGSYWAEVKQNSSFKDNSIGKADLKNNYTFRIRANDFINEANENNLSIIYKGFKYVVNDIRFEDELFRFVNITANGG